MATANDFPFAPKASGTQQQLMRSGTAVSEVLTSTARNLQLIQSKAGAEIFTRSMDSLAPMFSAVGSNTWFQQFPGLCQLQATTLTKLATDTFTELRQAQQTLMEMSRQPSGQTVQAAADATTQSLKKFYSRRMTRQVIRFPERRVA